MDKLDEIDIQILNILQGDARITNKELASRLGLSTTPIFERIKKLEKRGYIKNYVALVDNKLVNKSLIIFLFVSTKEHTKQLVNTFSNYVKEVPEVMECYHVSGDYDYLMKVVVNDMQSYETFLFEKLTSIDNIAHVKSVFALSSIKHKTSFYIENDN